MAIKGEDSPTALDVMSNRPVIWYDDFSLTLYIF